MNKKYIAIIDSGIGAVSVYREIKKLLPNENYIFLADSSNSPYGTKTKEQLLKIGDDIIKKLSLYDIKMVVIACNTLTTNTISYLREKYPDIEFVGTEPAIKVAYDYYRNKKTLVMATEGTIKSDRLMDLNKKYQQENRILLECPNLATLIEEDSLNELDNYLDQLFINIDCSSIEVVVLGCTHYPLVLNYIQKKFNNDTIFIDGSIGISKRVKYLLEQKDDFNTTESNTIFLIDDNKLAQLKKYLD